ncbi:MAG: membrane protein insertion efficiency factor YidD [Myxococcales bacterium]|nr:membrane protein insertion efficiency factor YidD [Myxococcales bacterium]
MPRVVLLVLLRAYQVLISPLLHQLFGSACRFEPSCSEYAVQVVRAQGVARGMRLALLRLCRCHPFHPGGYDPPPTRS